MMKKILSTLSVVVLLAVAFPAAGQRIVNNPYYDDEPYHFGFALGLNTMQYSLQMIDNYRQQWHNSSEWPGETGGKTLNVYNIVSSSTPGFSVGIVGNLRLVQYLDLRFIPTLSFGERQTQYTFKVGNDMKIADKSIFSTFVELPLLLKYKSRRVGNITGFAVLGPNFKLDLASQKSNEIEIDINGQTVSVVNNIKVKKNDLALDFGAGFDFYTTYFKFGVELKISYGLFDIIVPDDAVYTTSFDNIHNKVFMLSFTFE